jgi:hypothetical protein
MKVQKLCRPAELRLQRERKATEYNAWALSVGVRFALQVAGTASFGSLYRRSSNYEKPLPPVWDVPLKERRGRKSPREAFNDLVRRRLKGGHPAGSRRP